MKQTIFANSILNTKTTSSSDWSEQQYDQLKNQIIAYKYLIQNMSVPSDAINSIRSFTPNEWEHSRNKKIERLHSIYKEKFENQDYSIKSLSVYFEQRSKIKENPASLSCDLNFKNDIEYNVENEIENRKNQLEIYLAHIEKNDSNKELISTIKKEIQILNAYYSQKRVRKEVSKVFASDLDKLNTTNYADSILFKMLLDRRGYKKPNQFLAKRDQKLHDRFEQQLRNGYDIRKKEKQKEFLNSVINQQRDFMEFHKERKQKLKKRAMYCKSNIENLENKDKKEKHKKEKERIQYLKENDMEKYKKMLKDIKDIRIVEFMNQTDQFLKEIEDKIQIQKKNIALVNDKGKSENEEEDKMEVEENNEENKNNENNGEGNDNNAQTKEKKEEKIKDKMSSKNYYLSAHSYAEEIKTQPQMLKFGQLKSYQVSGLQWLVSLYVNNLNGILADEMGLGKTIQTIALLCYIIETKHNEGPFLIIAPLATISNWVLEFNRWAPGIKIVVYKGPPPYRRQLACQVKTDKHKFNVVLTTYEYIMKDKYSLNKITWQYIIVDEGHRMKNYKSKFTQTLGTQFNSVYRILLTGTPLQNNLSELWALLNFLLPKIFNSCEEFEKWFNQPFSSKMPGEKTSELTEEQELLIINRLHTVLRPFLLRREKKDVEKELPSKTEYVIKLDLSGWQRIVYNQIKNKGFLSQDPATGKIGKKALQNTMMQLRKICNHPYLFVDYNNSLIEQINELIYMSSGKFELLDRIIPKLLITGHKILIFSQMTQLMDILAKFFNFKEISFLRLDGNTKGDDREKQIQLFNDVNREYKVFILSTRAGGLGLNLQAADTVIIFDSDWNPQMDIQAQDRAHRIGQKQKVKVLRFISRDTIEEDILEKAAFKKNMDEKVIHAGLYNVKYSEQERKNKLLDIIKNEKEEDQDEDEIPDDSQINEYISRSDEEFRIFEKMDYERYQQENKNEKLQEIKEKMDYDDETIKKVNYRLMQEYEVPSWIRTSKDDLKGEGFEELGKGMRIRQKVNYKDDYDDDIDSDSESDSHQYLRKKRKVKDTNGDSLSVSYKKKKINSETSQLLSNELSQLDSNEEENKSSSKSMQYNKLKIEIPKRIMSKFIIVYYY